MTTQSSTLAKQNDSDLLVDDYLDALLATPAPAQVETVPVVEAAPAVEAAPVVEAEPVVEAAPPPPAIKPAPAPMPHPPYQAPALQETEATSEHASGQRWLRMAVGEDRYAVELLRVQEVVRISPLIAIRGTPPSLLGVMNLRGRVVPVHDLGLWLRRSPIVQTDLSRIVVLEHHDELAGLLVTSVTDVVTLEDAQIEPLALNMRNRIGLGIARTAGSPPTVLLDAQMVFTP